MEVNKIQLRGISRSPSDRMTSDGGCAESLNMFLHEDESAPVLIPKDITGDLGLPADLQAERIFIHKTANYENYIAISQNRVVAITPDVSGNAPTTILELQNGDTVNDITSIGNTIIIATPKTLHYILYGNRSYSYLGEKIPFPQIWFNKKEYDPVVINYEKRYSRNYAGTQDPDGKWDGIWFLSNWTMSTFFQILTLDTDMGRIPSEEYWNKENFDKIPNEEKYSVSSLLKEFKGLLYDNVITPAFVEAKKSGHFTGFVFVRYEVETYSGKISSIPILIPSSLFEITINQFSNISKIPAAADSGAEGYHLVNALRNEATAHADIFNIVASLQSDINLSQWKDLLFKINIYVSIPTAYSVADYLTLKNYSLSQQDTEESYLITESSGKVYLDKLGSEEQTLLEQSAFTYLLKSIPIFDAKGGISEELIKLKDGIEISLGEFADSDKLAEQPRLEGDDMKHYPLASNKIDVYNKSLLLIQPSQTLLYDYTRLNAYDRIEPGKDQILDIWHKCEVTYILEGATEDKVVKAGPFLYEKIISNDEDQHAEIIYPFQIFPDTRAKKMIVKLYKYQDSLEDLIDVRYGVFDMLPHPYLDCAYYYGGFKTDLFTLCNLDYVDVPNVNAIDDTDNKLLISELEDPFTFPLERRFTFQSKVLGVAVATTALSQGQFGQFPLYVFTEDGIWAMETGADGSFVTSKPLSRDVCVNPDSITSIDNAVVFVTDQGVMMLQGAQVVNISPDMNGRHYTIENVARTIIEGQKDFKDLLPVLSDSTHFMAFVKKASIAYDYAGKRLIFFKEDEAYQYIYKLDTNTWHKMALAGFDLIQPINSYPECLVQGKHKETSKFLVCIDNLSGYPAESILQMVEGYFPYKISTKEFEDFLDGKHNFLVTDISYDSIEEAAIILDGVGVQTTIEVIEDVYTSVYDLSTSLDLSLDQPTANGVIVTRPFDLGHPDVFKTITDIRVRGQYHKGAVKFILLGSNDGFNFYVLNSLRGKSWKLFRLIILADLEPTERISWVDVQYETRFTNRLR